VPASLADAGTPGAVSAGLVEVDDNSVPVTMLPFGAQGYPEWTAKGAQWGGNEALAVYASGNKVMAFNKAVVSPDEPYGTQLTHGSPVTVSVGSSYAVTWPAGMAGRQILGRLSTATHGFVQCIVDDSLGAMSFPVSLMNAFSASDVGTLDLARVAIGYASPSNAWVEITVLTGERVAVQYGP
jgi:hypothetical protein